MPFKKGESGNDKGRPFGSITKPRVSDFVTVEEAKALLKLAIKLANKGNVDMIKWTLEHLFGKAAQNINLGGQEDNPVVVDLPADVKTKLDKFLTTIKK